MTQLATLVENRDQVDAQIRELFGFDEGYHEPGMAGFGLENTVQLIGPNQYLEVCSQLKDGKSRPAVGGRRGYGGYMAIVQVPRRDDIEACRDRLQAQGLRVVHEIVNDGYASIHVHPRDLGTLVSFDWNEGKWPGIGADWSVPVRTEVVSAMTGIELRSSSPEQFAKRWATTLDLPLEDGVLTLPGDGFQVRFAAGRPDPEAGLDVIDFQATDPHHVGETHHLGGTEFRFV
jgi:hypothetical protein